MKCQYAWIALGVIAIIAGQAHAATVADSPSAAEQICTEKDPRTKTLVGRFIGCLMDKAHPLVTSDLGPEGIADAAVDGCGAEQGEVVEFAKSCHAPAWNKEAGRQIILGMIQDMRSRADFLWNYGDWQKASCSLQDSRFAAAVTAHINCMGTGDWSDATQIQSLGALGAAALAKCVAKEAPIRERITQCHGDKAAAIMTAFEAAEQEITAIVALEDILKRAMPKDASEAMRADKLFYLRETYDACFVFETKLRAVAGGDANAILLKASQVCLAARMDLADYAQQHLSSEDRHALLSNADIEATNMARLELEAVGLKAPSLQDR